MYPLARSIFEVTGPNSGMLLTLAEAKAILGIAPEDTTRDSEVSRLIAKISASIYRACKLRTDGINPPTLLSEEITETFEGIGSGAMRIMLSRRRVTEVTSISESGTELADADWRINRASGEIMRNGTSWMHAYWPISGPIVVDYIAGFETVPDDLKLAAETWLRRLWMTSYETPGSIIDPFLKVEDIPGVRRIERFVPSDASSSSSSGSTLMPPDVKSILLDGGYIETWIA